ncbi:hypothetical protein [Ureibacillus aquaedulcis]|uniref:Uncharacterized protein n=1 Tax=Ureibacillus aquaedulcis TaxID=3058421 RepID=A0ABT8GN93_9BACL|nr:hypothetical protein [Ureibacillus sp. BA0131]MDN4492875.1 hypothetical protein [Ureibacillus sp. BA0131]
MKLPQVNKCQNCGGTSFGGLGADGGPVTTALVSAQKKDGDWEINENNMLIVIPLICDNCKNVLLFADLD